MAKKFGKLYFYLFLFFLILVIGRITSTIFEPSKELNSKQFYQLLKDKSIVSNVIIEDGKYITGEYKVVLPIGENGTNIIEKKIPFKYTNNLAHDLTFLKELRDAGISYVITTSINFIGLFSLMSSIVLIYFMFRMFNSGLKGGAGVSTKSSLFTIINPAQIETTFADIAGINEIKMELEEIVDMVKSPQRYSYLNAKLPKGALLVGPPGTGKTLMAKAVAKEAGVPFIATSGSAFMEMYVGVGASRVRELLNLAKKNAPCVVFIDEIDSVGGKRDGNNGASNSEKEQTLNQLLVEMDGMNSSNGIFFLAATNREDMLDEALKRAGRFDRKIHVNPPGLTGRKAIFSVYLSKLKRLSEDTNVEELCTILAKGTPDFTGADIANLVNEATLCAARRGSQHIFQQDFDSAKEKILMGPENRSLIMSKDEKMKTSFHEVGHTLISELSENLDPIHKVTIIPRARSLGVTISLPSDDRVTFSKEKGIETIAMLMGGRVAEELFFNGHQSTGASNDIERATSIARNMVYSWGMSDLGPINIADDHNFKHAFSEKTREKADNLIMAFVEQGYKLAKSILKKEEVLVKKMAEALYEKETLDSNEIKEIIDDYKARVVA